jgi:multidrug efflux pump subunit AcrB
VTAPVLSRALRRIGDSPARVPRVTALILVVLTVVAALIAARLSIDRLMTPTTTRLDVRAELPGIDAATVETAVTKKLEAALSSLPGLRDIESRSRDGSADILLWLRASADRDRSLIVARERLAQMIPELPRGMKAPVVSLDHAHDPPAAVYAVTFAVLSDDIVRWVKNVLTDPMREFADVASVTIAGAVRSEILIQPDPRRLSGLGLSFGDVIDAARRHDIVARRKGASRAAAPTGSVESIAARAVRLPGGESIALAEVARISTAVAPESTPATYQDSPALRIEIFPRRPSNGAHVAERAQAHLAWLRANGLVPRGVTIHVLHDEARASARWLLRILQAGGICLAAIVIVVATFFRARIALYTTAAIGVWLVLSLALLALSGQALNVASAAGLVLAAAPLTLLMVSRFEVIDMWRIAVVGVIAWVAVLVLGTNAQASAVFSLGLGVAMVVRWLLSPWLTRTEETQIEKGDLDSTSEVVRPPTAFASIVALLTLVAAIGSAYALPAGGAATGKFTFRLYGDEPQRFGAVVKPLLVSLRVIPGVEQVASTAEQEERWRLKLDKERMEVIGIGLAEIGRAFAIANQGLVIGEIVDADRPLSLRLRLALGAVGDTFERLPLRGELPNQPAIYLRHVGIAERSTAPRELVRVDAKPAIEITASWKNADARAALRDFCRRVAAPSGLNESCSLRDSPI